MIKMTMTIKAGKASSGITENHGLLSSVVCGWLRK